MAPPGTHGRADMALVRHILGVQMLLEGHHVRWDKNRGKNRCCKFDSQMKQPSRSCSRDRNLKLEEWWANGVGRTAGALRHSGTRRSQSVSGKSSVSKLEATRDFSRSRLSFKCCTRIPTRRMPLMTRWRGSEGQGQGARELQGSVAAWCWEQFANREKNWKQEHSNIRMLLRNCPGCLRQNPQAD